MTEKTDISLMSFILSKDDTSYVTIICCLVYKTSYLKIMIRKCLCQDHENRIIILMIIIKHISEYILLLTKFPLSFHWVLPKSPANEITCSGEVTSFKINIIFVPISSEISTWMVMKFACWNIIFSILATFGLKIIFNW